MRYYIDDRDQSHFVEEDEGRFEKDEKQERYLEKEEEEKTLYLEKEAYFEKRRVHDHDHDHDLSLRELEQLRRT